MTRTLVVTNDFPPRLGGIEAYVAQVCAMLDPEDVVVLTSATPGAEAYDRTLPYPVHRLPTTVLLPTRRAGSFAADLLRRTSATRVLFGAAAPLGLLAPGLRAAGADRLIGLTHGHEVWWSRLPPTRALLRRIASALDVVGHISGFTGGVIGSVLPAADREKLTHLPPPVDTSRFVPGSPEERPRVVAAGRFVASKGFDVLLRAWARLLRDAEVAALRPLLHLVGDGPAEPAIRRAASRLPSWSVRIEGRNDHAAMPGVYAGARAFALPVRARAAGLEPEGLGLVFCEAAACGLPVLVGRSGGAVETLDDGRTGWALHSRDVDAWAAALRRVLLEPELAASAGTVGRAFVRERYDTTVVAERIRTALA